MVVPDSNIMKNGSIKRLRDSQIENSPYSRPIKKITPNSSHEDLSATISNEGSLNFTPRTSRQESLYNMKKIFQKTYSQTKLGLFSSKKQVNTLETAIPTTPKQQLPTTTTSPEKNNILWSTPNSLTSLRTISNDLDDCRNRNLITDFSELSIINSSSSSIYSTQQSHPIFEIPEIIDNIVKQLYLIENEQDLSNGHHKKDVNRENTSTVVSCLAVSKTWNKVSKGYLMRDLKFTKSTSLTNFLSQCSTKKTTPQSLILHKMSDINNNNSRGLEIIIDPKQLRHLEYYVCPNILPPVNWFQSLTKLEKLILPGNKLINDSYLIQICRYLPNLKVLDLRACDNITDAGIVAVGTHCKQLVSCNIGRHRNGSSITGLSVVALAKNTMIRTLGLAGCDITDASMWELAQKCGKNIERLSLNNCNKLTNFSLPMLFAFNYFPNLNVLEIQNIAKITDVRHMVRYKIWKRSQRIPILIKGCDRITKLIHEEERQIKAQSLKTARKDMTLWVNQLENE